LLAVTSCSGSSEGTRDYNEVRTRIQEEFMNGAGNRGYRADEQCIQSTLATLKSFQLDDMYDRLKGSGNGDAVYLFPELAACYPGP
jgi:hypothetical protein